MHEPDHIVNSGSELWIFNVWLNIVGKENYNTISKFAANLPLNVRKKDKPSRQSSIKQASLQEKDIWGGWEEDRMSLDLCSNVIVDATAFLRNNNQNDPR